MTQAKLKIKKGDEVIVLTGRDKGKKGEVTKVNLENSRVTVPGGIDTIELPIHASNVALVDPKSGKATRVGFKELKDGTKVRVARASGETID